MGAASYRTNLGTPMSTIKKDLGDTRNDAPQQHVCGSEKGLNQNVFFSALAISSAVVS